MYIIFNIYFDIFPERNGAIDRVNASSIVIRSYSMKLDLVTKSLARGPSFW